MRQMPEMVKPFSGELRAREISKPFSGYTGKFRTVYRVLGDFEENSAGILGGRLRTHSEANFSGDGDF